MGEPGRCTRESSEKRIKQVRKTKKSAEECRNPTYHKKRRRQENLVEKGGLSMRRDDGFMTIPRD